MHDLYYFSQSSKAALPALKNDNFVRINLKKKVFARRKGGGKTGSWHKRNAWKQKMKARSESFGSSKCYKCGEEGHWAKNCKGAASKGRFAFKSAKSSEVVKSVDECTVDETEYPSLVEAVNLSRGIRTKRVTSQDVVSTRDS